MYQFHNKPKDKLIEKERYDKKALDLIKQDQLEPNEHGSNSIPFALRSPYLFYEKKIREFIRPSYKVLEVGSGTGLHTYNLIKTGADVTATDTSSNSLKVLEKNLSKVSKVGLRTLVADMEQLPFDNASFDVVTIAGSLSYGDAKKVDSEIHRVIKPSGYFICVDSLNNNPIYKFNRYLHYLQGNRSKMTLLNMPSIKRLKKLMQLYSAAEVSFFGCVSYLMPFIKIVTGKENSKMISDFVVNYFV